MEKVTTNPESYAQQKIHFKDEQNKTFLDQKNMSPAEFTKTV